MSKYKKGDKFIVEIEDVYSDWVRSINEKEPFYKLKNLSAISLRECHLNKFDKIDETKIYEQGLEDAWEVARKIICEVKYGGFTQNELQKIFGEIYASDVMAKFTPAEAIVKIKEHEKNK